MSENAKKPLIKNIKKTCNINFLNYILENRLLQQLKEEMDMIVPNSNHSKIIPFINFI